MSYDEKQLQLDMSFKPRAVVETVRKGTVFTYNAEVMFHGQNYVLGTNPFTEYDTAKKAAEDFAAEMITDMLEAGHAHVARLKTATE